MQFIVTAGSDGWIRCWDAQAIIDAEPDHDSSLDFYITPTHEFSVAPDSNLSCARVLLFKPKENTQYLIYDVKGMLLQTAAESMLSSACQSEAVQSRCITKLSFSASFTMSRSPTSAAGSIGHQ